MISLSGLSGSARAILGGAIIIGCSAAVTPAQRPAQATIPAEALVLRINALELRRQLTTATAATIDSLLHLYSDSIVYEHPNAGAIVREKDVMRRNMMQYIGSARVLHADPPHVTLGPGVAVVETNVQMELKDESKWVAVTRHGLRVIEFDSRGLVRRIIDYPW